MVKRFYTGRGDDGTAGTLGKARIKKCDCLIASIGDVDELNSAIGVAIANSTDPHVAKMLKGIQNMLFTIGAELASIEGRAKNVNFRLGAGACKELDEEVEEISARLPPLKKFVLPGGSLQSSYLHLARSIARRAERSIVELSGKKKVDPNLLRYMNRLSTFLFVTALYCNIREGIDESHPSYVH
jgi:cob(I)alamin adenosyltransferase